MADHIAMNTGSHIQCYVACTSNALLVSYLVFVTCQIWCYLVVGEIHPRKQMSQGPEKVFFFRRVPSVDRQHNFPASSSGVFYHFLLRLTHVTQRKRLPDHGRQPTCKQMSTKHLTNCLWKSGDVGCRGRGQGGFRVRRGSNMMTHT